MACALRRGLDTSILPSLLLSLHFYLSKSRAATSSTLRAVMRSPRRPRRWAQELLHRVQHPADDGMTIVKRVLVGLGLAALVFALWSAWDREAMTAWKEDAGPLPFFAAMALLPAVGIPMTPFFVMAGATFGVGLAVFGLGAAWLNLAAKALRSPAAGSGCGSSPCCNGSATSFPTSRNGTRAVHPAGEVCTRRPGGRQELLARAHRSALPAYFPDRPARWAALSAAGASCSACRCSSTTSVV